MIGCRPLRSALLFVVVSASAQGQGNPEVVARLIDEGKNNSKVWETLTYLSEEIGPRLTGSSGLMRANTWTRDVFVAYGLKNVHLDKWGDIPVRFDRGPSRARMIAPEEREFEFTTRAWGAGTDGPVVGRVINEPKTLEELEAVRGDLAGAWVLGESRRRSRRGRSDEDEDARKEREAREAAAEEIAAAIDAAGIAGRLTASRNDLVLTGAERGWRDLTMDTLPTAVNVSIRRSDAESMKELIEAGEEVQVEIDLLHHFSEGPFSVFNTVAEIPGTELPDEVVIFSAHLDSWDGPGSQGAQDNGTGSSVMLEAARILMACEVKPKRTIRFCLWSGEEQGLYGSRGYVEKLTDEERAKISAAFVDDGGTNYQGGLVCVEEMKEMLDIAIAPVVAAFPDLDIANNVQDRMPTGGSSDHAPFNRAGIPGFFWIEKGSGGREEKNYGFIHHTQHDTTRYAVDEYLIQSATSSAITAYNLAMAETLLPREPAEPEAVASEEVDASFEVVSGPLSGNWEVELTGEGAPDIGIVFRLETASDGRIRGAVVSEMGESKISEGTWSADDSKLAFVAISDFGKLEVTGDYVSGDKSMNGTMAVGGTMTTSFSAKREPAAETPISGDWTALLIERDAEFHLHFEVRADGTLEGRFKSAQSDSPLYDGRWDAESKTLRFEYDYPHAGRLPVEAKLDGEKLKGTIGGSAEFEAVRKK